MLRALLMPTTVLLKTVNLCLPVAVATALFFLVLHPDFFLDLKALFCFQCSAGNHSPQPLDSVQHCVAKWANVFFWDKLIYNDFSQGLASVAIGYIKCRLTCSFWNFWLWLYDPHRTRQTCGSRLVTVLSTDRDFNCRVQSRELEGRSCHVSLFAREPSSLQRSTTLSPCTLFSPYSGPTWSTAPSHLHLTATTLMLLLLMIIMLFSLISHFLVPLTTKTFYHLAISLLSLLRTSSTPELHLSLKSGRHPSQTRTTLTS